MLLYLPPLIGIKNLNDHTSWSLFLIHYWWFKFADNWRHQGLLLPVFWPSLLSVVSSSGINSTSSSIHFTTSRFLCPEDLWLYFLPILCLTSAHGCSFPSALPNQMIICGGCSLSSWISQNFLFLMIFVSLLVSAIWTLPHLCLWVQTSYYSFSCYITTHYRVVCHGTNAAWVITWRCYSLTAQCLFITSLRLNCMLCALLTVPTALSLTACQGLPPYSSNLCQVYIPSFYYQLSILLLCFLCLLSINV